MCECVLAGSGSESTSTKIASAALVPSVSGGGDTEMESLRRSSLCCILDSRRLARGRPLLPGSNAESLFLGLPRFLGPPCTVSSVATLSDLRLLLRGETRSGGGTKSGSASSFASYRSPRIISGDGVRIAAGSGFSSGAFPSSPLGAGSWGINELSASIWCPLLGPHRRQSPPPHQPERHEREAPQRGTRNSYCSLGHPLPESP